MASAGNQPPWLSGGATAAAFSQQKLRPTALLRLQKDLKAIQDEPVPFICASFDPNHPNHVQALIVGPIDTPYEGGFFQFHVQTPHDYPVSPPSVKFLTTGQGTVRFNPNLYSCGKVCLSIIGTWQGPPWAASMTLQTLLVSIQSLMNETPYCNEPGCENEKRRKPIEDYNDFIRHETLRVAVCDQVSHCLSGLEYSATSTAGGGTRGAQMTAAASAVQNTAYYHSRKPSHADLPDALKEMVLRCFAINYDFYLSVCDNNSKLNGHQLARIAGVETSTQKFDFDMLRQRLVQLKSRADAWLAKHPE